MKAQQVHDADGLRVYVAVFDKDDEAVEGLTRLATDERLGSASLTAIGAFSAATVGYFDRETSSYLEIPVDEQVEVLALTGDVAIADGEPKLHAHVVLGRRDGTTIGGHLLEGRVWPTLEVVVTETPGHLHRRTDPTTGLALIDLAER
ncbi:MAG: PPC domain-containing DNA-binding protein [Acidimicrobiia bacterium]